MESCVITWKNLHEHGDLWWQHFGIRKQLFVDQKNWEIPHNALAEWDQYDTANTIYVLTHEDGKVIAASRINPCDFAGGGWSYMIRDACLGRLDGIPRDILDTPPTNEDTWEATRFTVDPSLAPEMRNAALATNAKALANAAKSQGINHLIALMPPAYIRWLTRIGLKTERLGPTKFDHNGEKICVMQMSFSQ